MHFGNWFNQSITFLTVGKHIHRKIFLWRNAVRLLFFISINSLTTSGALVQFFDYLSILFIKIHKNREWNRMTETSNKYFSDNSKPDHVYQICFQCIWRSFLSSTIFGSCWKWNIESLVFWKGNDWSLFLIQLAQLILFLSHIDWMEKIIISPQISY